METLATCGSSANFRISRYHNGRRSGEGLRNPHNCHRPHSKWQSDEFHFDHCQKITVTQLTNSWGKIGDERDFKNQEQT